MLLFSVLAVLAVFLLAPLWIPVLLAFVAYRLIRARSAQPQRHNRAAVI